MTVLAAWGDAGWTSRVPRSTQDPSPRRGFRRAGACSDTPACSICPLTLLLQACWVLKSTVQSHLSHTRHLSPPRDQLCWGATLEDGYAGHGLLLGPRSQSLFEFKGSEMLEKTVHVGPTSNKRPP